MGPFNFKVEFAVQMKCNDCKAKIIRELSVFKSVQVEDINVDEQRVILNLNEDSPSTFQIQELIEKKLKLNTIVRGTGNFCTAVCELRGSCNNLNVFGVARFIENEQKQCLMDIVIDGLKSFEIYNIGIHEYGDMSGSKFQSVGEQIYSIRTNISLKDHKFNLKKKLDNFDLISVIGRSLVVNTEKEIIAAGVIARASKIMDNIKKICACSGKTLWQERENSHIV